MTSPRRLARRVAVLAVLLAMVSAGIGCAGRTSPPNQPGRQSHPDPLVIRTSAHVVNEPAQILVRTRVDPDARNRALTIEWWSADGIGGSHSVSLDGERAATLHNTAIKAMSSGEYVLTAVLTRMDGTRLTRGTKVVVIGENTRPDADTFGPLGGQ